MSAPSSFRVRLGRGLLKVAAALQVLGLKFLTVAPRLPSIDEDAQRVLYASAGLTAVACLALAAALPRYSAGGLVALMALAGFVPAYLFAGRLRLALLGAAPPLLPALLIGATALRVVKEGAQPADSAFLGGLAATLSVAAAAALGAALLGYALKARRPRP